MKGDQVVKRGVRGPDNLYRSTETNKTGSILMIHNIEHEESEGSSSSDDDNFENYNNDNQLRDWHNRLGHLSKSGIRHLARLGRIEIKKSDLQRKFNCADCQKGKEHTKGFNKKGKSARLRTSRPGELVYSDTYGPLSIPDKNEDIYLQTYIDDFTCLTVTFLMKSKTQTLSNLE